MSEWRAPEGSDVRALLHKPGEDSPELQEGTPRYSLDDLAAMGYESADFLRQRERATAEARDVQFTSRYRLPQDDADGAEPTGTRAAREPTRA